jgi:hypothetical protein
MVYHQEVIFYGNDELDLNNKKQIDKLFWLLFRKK